MAMKDSPASTQGSNCFKEAVCIDTKRIYDSASDKDCLDDLQVYFTDEEQHIVDNASSVKIKDCRILDVYLDVEPIPFNKGFYGVDITFFFEVKLNIYTAPLVQPVSVSGLSVFSKKVILYGSDGSVSTFSSDKNISDCKLGANNDPVASVQCVDPVCLSVKLMERCECSCDPCCEIPQNICQCFSGRFCNCERRKHVFITLGLFTIVQLERRVQMMIPAYDFCVPEKASVASASDDPCELFKKIKFPTDAFFPPKMEDASEN